MPAVTRNQHKNIVAAKPVIVPVPTITAHKYNILFVSEMKDLLLKCESCEDNQNKMIIALKIYEKINKELSNRIAEDGLDTWINYIATVYQKTSEFIREMNSGAYFVIDKNIVENFFSYVFQVRDFTSNIIKNYCGNVSDHSITRAKEEITRLDSRRPRRNIPRVNYTGMDTIEPESEFHGNDLTLSEDPDYEFEEDEDDEQEDRRRWEKINPAESKQHLVKLVQHNRVRGSAARVNYTGINMREEDEGKIRIAKRRFKDGKIKYFWKSVVIVMLVVLFVAYIVPIVCNY